MSEQLAGAGAGQFSALDGRGGDGYGVSRVRQSWQAESEIEPSRRQYLAQRRDTITVDVERGIFPFKGVSLTRADIEWLLASHDGGRGPVIWGDDAQHGRTGLDLRGADLHGVNLSGLPLAYLLGGLTVEEREALRTAHYDEDPMHVEDRVRECSEMAAVHLEGANLTRVHLEGAVLRHAHMQAADLTGALMGVDESRAFVDFSHEARRNLREARMEGTDLRGAHLEAAILSAAHLERAALIGAHLEGADLFVAHLEGAYINDAHFEGRRLSSEELEQFKVWLASSEEEHPGLNVKDGMLRPADLRGVYFDIASSMWRANLGDRAVGTVRLADARWGGANVSVINWDPVQTLGDELDAGLRFDSHGKRKSRAKRVDDYQAAVRTYRQVATALQSQGSAEDANRYAYRAQVVQRQVYRFQRHYVRRVFSGLLDVLAGYGYRPQNSLYAYLLTIGTFGLMYYVLGQQVGPPLSPIGAFVFSMTSFHGRGFFPGGIALDDPITVVAALEALFGLIIEVSVIATFTQRFFGKGAGA